MDWKTKTGKVHLQSHKSGKKWKPVWLSLFPPSSNAMGRLEIQEIKGADAAADQSPLGIRKYHHGHGERRVKVVRLSELISVLRLPPNAEACPMENMSAFCVETEDRTLVFAAFKDDCADWVNKLCDCTFQKNSSSASTQLHMEENQIYVSADEATEFFVAVRSTDAATHCGLQGSYWLQVGPQSLQLSETQKRNVVGEWPYELLRRYGKDKMTLTIEAGRRCTSGPGTFIFETQQADKIFSLIQSNIKRKKPAAPSGNQSQEGDKVFVPNIRPHSPLPKVPDVTGVATLLENKLRTHGRKSPALDKSSMEDSAGQSEQPPLITLMPLPSIPTQENASVSHRRDRSDNIYADPTECIKPVLSPEPRAGLYVDPACVLPLTPPDLRNPVASIRIPSSAQHPVPDIHVMDPDYSEVFDKISPDQNKELVLLQSHSETGAGSEIIYAEPVRKNDKKESPKTQQKPDPFTHLYAQVSKKPPSPSSNLLLSASTATALSSAAVTMMSTDEVIYENLGII
ncbi:docking protein 2 [Pholidichthys leucotaenia]